MQVFWRPADSLSRRARLRRSTTRSLPRIGHLTPGQPLGTERSLCKYSVVQLDLGSLAPSPSASRMMSRYEARLAEFLPGRERRRATRSGLNLEAPSAGAEGKGRGRTCLGLRRPAQKRASHDDSRKKKDKSVNAEPEGVPKTIQFQNVCINELILNARRGPLEQGNSCSCSCAGSANGSPPRKTGWRMGRQSHSEKQNAHLKAIIRQLLREKEAATLPSAPTAFPRRNNAKYSNCTSPFVKNA